MEAFETDLDKSRSQAVVNCRHKIANMSYTLNNISFLMVFYSLVYLMLKLADFQGVHERLRNFEENHLFEILSDSKRHKEIYYTVNVLSLSLAFFACFSTIYVKLTL